jgi:hypothetical protein
MDEMIRANKIMLLAAALVIGVLTVAAGAGKGESVKVEGTASLKGVSRDEAREAALLDGKRNAVLAFVSGMAPAAVMEEKKADLAPVLAKTDDWVVSWEVGGEKEEGGKLVLEVSVELSKAKLESALKLAGVLPSRALPRVFVAAQGKLGDDVMKSGWDKAADARGFNVCEAAIATELMRYGIPVVERATDGPAADADKIINPGGDEEKQQVFKELKEKFSAGVLVVGIFEAAWEDKKDKEEVTLASVRIAAADVDQGQVVFTDEVKQRFELKGIPFREEQLKAVCQEAGDKTATALFRAWTPKFKPGEEREIAVVVQGLKSYAVMQELLRKLREEAPGVKSAELSRVGPGEVEFTARTTAAAGTLADWLIANDFLGARLSVEKQEDTRIELKAKTAP